MKLKVKDINLSSGGPLVAVLNKDDAIKFDLHPSDRIVVKKNKRQITVILDVAETNKTVRPGEIGLFEESLSSLKVKNKTIVNVSLSKSLASIQSIKNKLQGKRLIKKEFDQIIKDVVGNKLSEVELTYFISGCFSNGLTMKETIGLTEAIVKNSGNIKIKKYPIVDKHSVGGVPGNRTTMIMIPILAAAGLTIPKTSSKAISTPSGTANTMSVLANVSFPLKKIKEIIRKTNGCMVWGGGFNLAAADDKLIRVRHSLRLDPEGILLASIIAKKATVNATHVLIDIPVGKEAKVKKKKDARRLKRKFIKLGKKLGMKVKVVITDGNEPIGNGIGPALEARDILLTLQGNGPEDLKKKSLKMASILLKMVSKKKKKATEILNSGLAYKKMKEIIKAQGGNPNIKPENIPVGKFTYNVKSKKKGIVTHINNNKISKLARIAGAPIDKGAGLYLNVHTKHKVKRNEVLFTIYSESKKRLNYAIDFLKNNNPIKID